jgi:hypothetical protein
MVALEVSGLAGEKGTIKKMMLPGACLTQVDMPSGCIACGRRLCTEAGVRVATQAVGRKMVGLFADRMRWGKPLPTVTVDRVQRETNAALGCGPLCAPHRCRCGRMATECKEIVTPTHLVFVCHEILSHQRGCKLVRCASCTVVFTAGEVSR